MASRGHELVTTFSTVLVAEPVRQFWLGATPLAPGTVARMAHLQGFLTCVVEFDVGHSLGPQLELLAETRIPGLGKKLCCLSQPSPKSHSVTVGVVYLSEVRH